MTHSQKIFRNTIFSVGNKILTIVIGFVTRKVFIMYLSAELLGLSSLFADLLGLLNLADMGLAIAVQFNLYKPLADGNHKKVGQILNASKHIYNIIGIGIIVAGIVLSFFIQFLIKENPYDLHFLRLVFIINVVSNASTYFFVHKRIFVQVTENLHITNVIDSSLQIICSLLRILVIVVWQNYVVYVLIGAVQAFASNYLHSVVCDKKYPYLKEVKGYTKEDMRPLLANIKELVPNKVSSFIYSNTDSTIISAFLGLTTVAIYTSYNGVSLQLFTMTAMLAGIMKVSFGNMMQRTGDHNSQMFFLNAYQLLQFFYSSFCGVALFCLLDEFVEFWYGKEFVAPFAFVVLLTLDFFVHCMFQPLNMMIEVLGEFKSLKRQEIVTMILNITISLLLIKPFGIIGPVLGTLLADICTTVFRLFSIIHKHYREQMTLFVKRYIVYTLVFIIEYIGVYLLCELVPLAPSFSSVLVKGMICVAIVIPVDLMVFYRCGEFAYLKECILGMIKK